MRLVAALLVIALLFAAVPGPAAGQSGDAVADGVTVAVHLSPNGDARWNVSTRVVLDSASDRAAFADLADDVENGSDPPGFDVETARLLAERATERTGRAMRVTDVERTARVLGADANGTTTAGGSVENASVGLVTVTFTWERFAAVDGRELVVGDAFESWTLAADQRLELHPPARYGLESTSPAPDRFDEGALYWNGPASFGDGEPAITFAPTVSATTGTAIDGPTDSGPGVVFALAVGGAVVLGGLAAYVVARRGELFGDDEGGGDGDATGAAASDPPDDDGGGAPVDGAERGGGAVQQTVDPELLSDEERVEQLLAANGGRMKQADIVAETGWSNAKVSQLLSGMDEADRVEKLRIGRENLISLPDAEED